MSRSLRIHLVFILIPPMQVIVLTKQIAFLFPRLRYDVNLLSRRRSLVEMLKFMEQQISLGRFIIRMMRPKETHHQN